MSLGVPPGGLRPPSFPTARSAHIRTGIFVTSAIAWAASMWAVHTSGAPAEVETEEGVFSEAFERNLRMGVRVVGPGLLLEGAAVRRTREPYEGRLVIEEEAKAEGVFLAGRAGFELRMVSRWERLPAPVGPLQEDGRSTGVFRMAELRTRVYVASIIDEDIRATATRSGDVLVVRYDVPAAGSPSVRTLRLPKGAELSAGLMDASKVRPPYVGAKWTFRTVGISGEVVSGQTEVVERTHVEIAGIRHDAFRAVSRVQGPSGASRELSSWYDLEGRALRQEMSFGPLTIIIEKLERLPAGT